jgi:hypothetical protein
VWGPLLSLAVAGVVVAVAFVFWADIQNWMAGVIERAQRLLGPVASVMQSALVVLDRVMVNGQRVVIATGKLAFQEEGTNKVTVHEEVRQIDPQALPADVKERLEKGQSMTYKISGEGTTN